MDFASQTPYVDVCVEYALCYSAEQLSNAFSLSVARICCRHQDDKHATGKPALIQHGPFDTEVLPTNIEDGLWHFFGNRLTRSWSNLPFAVHFQEVKQDMMKCYVPFRLFSEESFQDAMRLRVYQDSLNIIAGRSLDNASSRRYSSVQKALHRLKKSHVPPEL